MDHDLYRVLGVKRSATHDEIRGAYRKLAKQYHPDRNPGDKNAEERFKQVSLAFDILGDPEKRKRYDNGEIDSTGQERGPRGGYSYRGSEHFNDFADFGDIFGDFFGRGTGSSQGSRGGHGGFNMRGMDYRYNLEVEFLEAVNGAKKRVLLPEGETLDINVPSGVVHGQTLRLKGKGGPGVGRGQPGDALIELKIKPHPFFQREGDDIMLDLPVGIHEAVMGAKVEAPTINGRVSIAIPKGASSGQTLRLRGRGVKNTQTKTVGDQLVRLLIALPQRVDRELLEFMEDWSELHAYDPRTKLKETI